MIKEEGPVGKPTGHVFYEKIYDNKGNLALGYEAIII